MFPEYATVGYMAKRIQMRKNRFQAIQKMAESVKQKEGEGQDHSKSVGVGSTLRHNAKTCAVSKRPYMCEPDLWMTMVRKLNGVCFQMIVLRNIINLKTA